MGTSAMDDIIYRMSSVVFRCNMTMKYHVKLTDKVTGEGYNFSYDIYDVREPSKAITRAIQSLAVQWSPNS